MLSSLALVALLLQNQVGEDDTCCPISFCVSQHISDQRRYIYMLFFSFYFYLTSYFLQLFDFWVEFFTEAIRSETADVRFPVSNCSHWLKWWAVHCIHYLSLNSKCSFHLLLWELCSFIGAYVFMWTCKVCFKFLRSPLNHARTSNIHRHLKDILYWWHLCRIEKWSSLVPSSWTER